MSPKKTVLVVGGGGAGAKLARALSEKLDPSKHDLILISSHPFYIHYPAGLRMLVTTEGSLEDRALIPFDKLFVNGNGKFRQGTVTAIEAERGSGKGGKVVLESGETIGYDVLALAPGSHLEAFLTFSTEGSESRAHIEEWRKKFKEAKKVVIAGGGSVGIELAGELKDYYPEKDVTIVHGGRRLLHSAYPDKFRKAIEKSVRGRKIKLILDDYVDEFPATTTRKGETLDADLIVPARGPRPNTEFIAKSLGSDSVTDKGSVKIKPTMQLLSYANIFAVGDVIDHPEQKQVAKYPGHATHCTANILTLLNGEDPAKPYKSMFEGIVITNGRKGGAGFLDLLWGMVLGSWMTSTLKSKNLFVDATRQSMGYTS